MFLRYDPRRQFIQLSTSGTTVAKQRRGATRLDHSKPVANRSSVIWGLGSVLVVALVISLFSGDKLKQRRPNWRLRPSTLNAGVEPDILVEDTLPDSVVNTAETIEPTWRDIKVRDGDNLSLILREQDLATGMCMRSPAA